MSAHEDSSVTSESVAVDASYPWNYTVPSNPSRKMQLLTIGDIAVYGPWRGRIGEFYKAWAPMPKRDKQRERELGLLFSEMKR